MERTPASRLRSGRRYHLDGTQVPTVEDSTESMDASADGHPTRVTDEQWDARFGFSRTTTVSITNHDQSDGQSSCDDEELSELIDSDSFSNPDIIPFPHHEYEKICVDTDCQTEPNGQLSPGGASASSKGSGCSSGMDPAIDSALGRSVSDHSINNDIHHHQLACQSALRITTDQVNRAVNKVVSFAQEEEMRGYSDKANRAGGDPGKVRRMKTKGDHDIGYSSESHSNDEPDFGCRSLVGSNDQEVPTESLESPSEGSPDSSIERPRSLNTIVFRRANRANGSEEDDTQGDSGTGPSPLTPEKSWRHSMTSAYDTSSQCSASRSNSPFDLNATLDTTCDTSVCTTVDQADVDLENDTYSSLHELMSSSSQSFYVMTSVESDTETASYKPPSELNVSTGDDPDREGSEEEDDQESPKRFLLDQSTPVKSQNQKEYARSSPSPGDFRCTPIKGHKLLTENLGSGSGDAHVDSDGNASDASLSKDDPLNGNTEVQTLPEQQSECSSIHKLVEQAEFLVRESELGSSPSSKLRRRRKGRRHRLAVAPIDSYTDTTNATSDSLISSCDASAESTESESEAGLTSDPDRTGAQHLIRGVEARIALGQKCHTLPRARCDQRKGDQQQQQQRHTCSVTQLYELSNRLDLSPFSISEGAINCAATARKVRRLSATPYRKRKLLPRSASYECGQTLSTSSLCAARECCSMPSSRQQSSQEWVAQQQQQPLLSRADRIPNGETRQRARPAVQSDGPSDTDVSADRPKESLLPADSDNDAAWGPSVFNTTGEFSENAWDPYQDPPYHVTSDDPTEARLDPLGFDCDLEYDDHFHLDTKFDARSRDNRISLSTSYRDLPQLEDSDSDLEDLQHVLEESRKQIGVAETVLGNTHKDGLGTGLYLDPSPYTELLATSQTNMKCLEVLCETIDSGEVTNNTFTEHDIQVVMDVIERWGQVQGSAMRRQAQARELTGLVREMAALRASVTDAAEELDLLAGFDDVTDLEGAVKDLQARAMELSLQRPAVDGVMAAARAFSVAHTDINMSGFAAETHDLAADMYAVIDRCSHQVSVLKSALMAWYDFRETTKELAYLVGRDRTQLQVLAMTYDVIAVCLPDAVDTVHDLKLMQAELELYELKLGSLRILSAEVLAVCDEAGGAEVRRVLAGMDADVSSIRAASQDLMSTLQEKITKQGGAGLLGARAVPRTALQRVLNDTLQLCRPAASGSDRLSLPWRVCRVAVPLHLALILLLGIAYLLDPQMFDICISPQLRYVRGPPPV